MNCLAQTFSLTPDGIKKVDSVLARWPSQFVLLKGCWKVKNDPWAFTSTMPDIGRRIGASKTKTLIKNPPHGQTGDHVNASGNLLESKYFS